MLPFKQLDAYNVIKQQPELLVIMMSGEHIMHIPDVARSITFL